MILRTVSTVLVLVSLSQGYKILPGQTHYDSGPGNLPNDTKIAVVVAVDETWIITNNMNDFGALETTITNSIRNAQSWYITITDFTYIQLSGGNVTDDFDEEDTNVLVTLTDCENTHHINSQIYDNVNLLHLGITDFKCARLEEGGLLIPITEPGSDLLQLLLDFKNADTFPHWETYNLVMDDTITTTMEHEIYNILSVNTSLATFRANSGTQFKPLLDKIDLYHVGGKFLFMIKKSLVSSLIRAIDEMKLFNHIENEFAIIITDTNHLDHDVSSFLAIGKEGYNLAFIANASIHDSNDCPWGLQCIAEEIGTALIKGWDTAMMGEMSGFTELAFSEFDILRPSIRGRYREVARKVKGWMETEGKCNRCIKYKMNTIEGTTGGNVAQLDAGYWTPAGPYIKDTLFPHVSCGMRARTINVASIEYPPWQTYIRNDKGEVVDYSGFIFEVLNQISYKLNFTYNVVEPSDGTWNGMINHVENYDVMIGAAAFAKNSERMERVDFTDALDLHPYGFIYKKPKAVSKELLLINPFELPVWIGVAIMVVIIGPIYYVVHRSSIYYDYYGERNEYGLFQMNRCILYCFGGILQQGGAATLPTADSGKVFITAWWLFVIIVVTYYSGALTALILIPQIEPALNDFETMVKKSGQYDWGFLGGSDIEKYLSESTETLYSDILEAAERYVPNDLLPNSPLYDRIQDDDLVYIGWMSYLEQMGYEQYQITKSCDYSYSKLNIFYEHVALAFPKHSPWVSKFNREIKLMLQSGMTIAWKKKYWPPENECNIKYVPKFTMIDPVIVPDMQGAFYILFSGIVISAFFLLGEKVYFNNNKNKATSNSQKSFTP